MCKKVAIVHDWLNGMRGGEKVLECCLDIWPQADIFTLFYEPSRVSDKINSHKVTASWLNRYPFIKKRYRYFLQMLPAAIESFDLNDYDLVLSISHCVAKGIIPAPDAVHISYVNSPMRYIWDQYHSYFGDVKGLKKMYLGSATSKLRQWDVSSSSRVDEFIGNSSFIAKRINRYYNREASVINPPVEIDYFTPAETKEDYYLVVAALVPYKRVDYLVKAFNRNGRRLIVVGKGPEEEKLRKIAKNNIEFRKDLPSEELRNLFQKAKAFVYSATEDFGIVYVEAMACGTPLIAYEKGGIQDIADSECGVLYKDLTVEGICSAVEEFENRSYDVSYLREKSMRFSKENFVNSMKETAEKYL